jgi:hypothetical protein
VAGRAAEVDEATAREQRDALAVREDELIALRLDARFLDLRVVLEPRNRELAVVTLAGLVCVRRRRRRATA